MREVLEKKPSLTKEEARDLIDRCMKILYYRDARSFNRVSAGLWCGWAGGAACRLRASSRPQASSDLGGPRGNSRVCYGILLAELSSRASLPCCPAAPEELFESERCSSLAFS